MVKCKAIAHGKVALKYISQKTKLRNRLLIQSLCGNRTEKRDPKTRVKYARKTSKEKLRTMAYELLGKYTNGGVNGYASFRYDLT